MRIQRRLWRSLRNSSTRKPGRRRPCRWIVAFSWTCGKKLFQWENVFKVKLLEGREGERFIDAHFLFSFSASHSISFSLPVSGSVSVSVPVVHCYYSCYYYCHGYCYCFALLLHSCFSRLSLFVVLSAEHAKSDEPWILENAQYAPPSGLQRSNRQAVSTRPFAGPKVRRLSMA